MWWSISAGLKRLPNLNTLVLKHNAIKELGSCLHKCTALQKLSMAHNQLSNIGDALVHCTALKELRLNHNAIARLPLQLSANSQLRILDLGDNPIPDTDAIKVQHIPPTPSLPASSLSPLLNGLTALWS